MTRRSVFGAVVCVAAAMMFATALWCSGSLYERQAEIRDTYERAIARQTTTRVPLTRRSDPSARTYCLRRLDTPVVALARAQTVVGTDGVLNIAAFHQVSAYAVQADRYLERSAAGGLPQRLGRRPLLDADGSVRWRPLSPHTVTCAGRPAVSSFRMVQPHDDR